VRLLVVKSRTCGTLCSDLLIRFVGVWEGGRVTGYGLELDAVEHARLRAQAAGVHRLDDDLWPLAGVVSGADVVDLGCGPAAVMLELPEQAGEFVGLLAMFVALDNPTSSARTRELLGWQPTEPGLLEDLAQGHYFDSPVA
jgi:hypothetical protein